MSKQLKIKDSTAERLDKLRGDKSYTQIIEQLLDQPTLIEQLKKDNTNYELIREIIKEEIDKLKTY